MVDVESREGDLTPKEIERKFLIERSLVPNEVFEHGDYIRQGYLEINDDSSEVRIRERSGVYTKTHKYGSGLVRGEVEESLSEDEFMKLWDQTEGQRIEKYRYSYPYQGSVIELDEYTGDLLGLMVAEVEFPSELTALSFPVPQWFGAEVTGNKAYKNQQLALNGLPNQSQQELLRKLPELPLTYDVKLVYARKSAFEAVLNVPLESNKER